MAMIAAALLYATTVPLSAYAWQRLLASLGHRQGFARLDAILLTTQIGKYLPGNVGQHLGRIGLALAQGIPAPALFASMAYEVVLLLLAGVLVGLVCGAVSAPGLVLLLHHQGAALLTAIALVVAGLVAIPSLGKALPWLVTKIAPTHDVTAQSLRVPASQMPALLGIYAVAYLVIGGTVSLLAIGLLPGTPLDFALLTAAFAIAWVAGFVTPGAPAGIGVREALLLLMLGGSLGAVDSSLLILALRIVTTLGDILCLVAGLVQMAWLRRNAGAVAALKS